MMLRKECKINYYYIISGMCSLQKLSTASTLWMFGKPDATGNARMYTASGSFHFGAQRNETHVNKTTVRGIKCDLWRSCQYWPELNATMILDWYFSGKFMNFDAPGKRRVRVL